MHSGQLGDQGQGLAWALLQAGSRSLKNTALLIGIGGARKRALLICIGSLFVASWRWA